MASKLQASPRVAALEADLERTRLRLGRDVSALRSKLTATGLMEEAKERLRRHQAQSTALGAVSQNESWQRLSRTSPTLTLLGAGLAWLLLRSSRQAKEV